MKISTLRYVLISYFISCFCTVLADESIDMKGISIIGNKELPNVLYIVPWKSPDLPVMNDPPLASLIDAALEPLDRESILRKELYHKTLNAQKNKLTSESKKEK